MTALGSVEHGSIKWNWRGSAQASPDVLLWACGLSWAEAIKTPWAQKKKFYLSLKEFKLGALPVRVITRNNFLEAFLLWQGKHLITEHLLLLLSCKWHSFPLNPRGILPHPELGMPHISHFNFLHPHLSHTWGLWLSHEYRVSKHVCVTEFGCFLLLIRPM